MKKHHLPRMYAIAFLNNIFTLLLQTLYLYIGSYLSWFELVVVKLVTSTKFKSRYTGISHCKFHTLSSHLESETNGPYQII